MLNNEHLSPQEIVSSLKFIPSLKLYYESKVRHYTLEEHTILVIGQFDKYFLNTDSIISKSLFRFILAIHDIGKPKAYSEGNINNQHKETLKIINEIKCPLQLNSEVVDLCLAIIDGDPIGKYFQYKQNISKTISLINYMKRDVNLTLSNFFRLLTIFYQCDAGSYTEDAGGFRFLEHIFSYKDGLKIFDAKKGILKFSPIFESRYYELEMAIK